MRSLLIPCLILAALATSGCGSKQEASASNRTSPPVQISTTPAIQAEWPSVYRATGTVRAKMSSQIAGRVMGYVREVRVNAGDRVHTGQTLVILDAQDLEVRERQADAARNEAQAAEAEADRAVESAKV